jgi:3-deoxy-D-manno-octulosonic-acid transferase
LLIFYYLLVTSLYNFKKCLIMLIRKFKKEAEKNGWNDRWFWNRAGRRV